MFLSQANKEINVAALPFVSEKALHKLVEKYVETPDCDINIDALYPFLSAQDISLLFNAYLSKHRKTEK